MAKMTELDAINLLAATAALTAQLAILLPTLVSNYQAIKDGLANDDANDLNTKIAATHSEVQALNEQLLALRS